VEDCAIHFERLATQAFTLWFFPWLLRRFLWAYRIVSSLINDGIYPASRFDALLQEFFSTPRTILDCSSATAIGAKVGITVSTMKPEPFIFTNYNGVGSRPNKKYEKYGVLLGSTPLWEMLDVHATSIRGQANCGQCEIYFCCTRVSL